MSRQTAITLGITVLLPVAADAQSLTGLRIEGPGEVVENTVTLYTVVAEFDNGWEFEVTLDSFLWLDPGIYADIGVFGDFEAFEVTADTVETINAYYTFGPDEQTATFDVTILNIPPGGYALDFDGADDAVIVPQSPALEPTEALTIECWVKGVSGGSDNPVLVRNAASFDAGVVLRWNFQNTSRVHFQLAKEGLTEEIWVVDPTPNTEYGDEWHHFAGVYSAPGDFARLYVDGDAVAEVPGFGPLEFSASDLTIGRHLSGEAYHGQIDEVRIWNVARTGCEIRRHMHRPLNGTEPGLVGYWRFDEADGQYAYDSSPYANHGVLGNNDDTGGDAADPQWLISSADLDDPPYDPPYWTTPELVSEVSSGEDWNVAISADQLEMY
ncbi:MAG: LamG domain-containing protein, partial [Planctomycetota bacterium]